MTRRKGFTLIELLVVIAIIAILAAMLFPVFARARESARKIQCLANVKNIATAMQMYLTDYDRFPPDEHRQEVRDAFYVWPGEDRGCTSSASYRATWANPFLRWQVILDEYVKNRDVWRCPSAGWDPSNWWIVPQYMGDWFRYLAATRGQWWMAGSSTGGSACSWAFPPGWGGSVTDAIGQQAGNISPEGNPGMFSCTIGVTVENTNVKTSQIGDASWFVVCADGTQFGAVILGGATMLYERCAVVCGGANWSACSWTQECGLDPGYWETWHSDASVRAQDTRHMGGSNVGFADGHAAWWHGEAFNAQRSYCGPLLPDGCCVTHNADTAKLEGLCGKF